MNELKAKERIDVKHRRGGADALVRPPRGTRGSKALAEDEPQVLRREKPRVDGLDERRVAGNLRPFRPLVNGADLIDVEAVLAREERQRGGVARREVRRVAPELGAADEERLGVRRLDHQQSAGSQRARRLREEREERVDRQML